MDARLLKAALTLLAHGERVEVQDMISWQKCFLLGAGSQPRTVRLGVWCEAGELSDQREFRYCRVPGTTLARLEAVVNAQSDCATRAEQIGGQVGVAPTAGPSPEVLRALEFAARARETRQRGRDGRFSDGTHGCQKAGRI
jgi:hypothetical protein